MGLVVALFVAVAAFGFGLGIHEVQGRHVPLPVGLLHGLGAVAAIALLVVHDVHASNDLLANSATAVFVLAALGGLLIFMFRIRRQSISGLLISLHAGFALFGVLLLVLGYFGH